MRKSIAENLVIVHRRLWGCCLDKAIYLSSRRSGIQKGYFIVKNRRSGKRALLSLLHIYVLFYSQHPMHNMKVKIETLL